MTTTAATARADAPTIAEAEYAALLESLSTLAPSAWSAPTDCPGWTVREMVAHVVGAAEEAVRPLVMLRHFAVALPSARRSPIVDALNDQQIRDRRGQEPEELVSELRELAPRATRARSRLPSLLRSLPLPDPGALAGDTLTYLNDVIYTRDVWMHRIDIARATSTPMVESPSEPEVVAQIMRDLSRAWDSPALTLVLTGRVPGTWQIGRGDPGREVVTVDAVALCRTLAGRSDETDLQHDGRDAGLLARLRSSRVLF